MINNTSQTKDNNFSVNKHSLQAIFGIPGVVFYDSVISDNLILLSARLKGKTAKCTCCGKRSKSVHSSYTRKLTDLSAVGRAVKILLKVRKFRCRNSNCTQTVFSEQHLPLTRKYSRLTDRTNHYLQRLLIEVSSRKGEYISSLFSIKQSSSTCLRIVKSIEMPDYQELTTIGIDDWHTEKANHMVIQSGFIRSFILLFITYKVPANPNHIMMFLSFSLKPLKLLEATIQNLDHVNRPMAIQNN